MHKTLKEGEEILKGGSFQYKTLMKCWKCYLMSIYFIFPWHKEIYAGRIKIP